jgi:ribulose-5-phosphate 4-epimerase/fuculose-1-phosphate aldolase
MTTAAASAATALLVLLQGNKSFYVSSCSLWNCLSVLFLFQARLNQDQEHFLVNPFGMLYHEITASSLVKIDMQGSVVEQGTTNFGIDVAGFMLHSAIHAARPDIRCIIHIRTPSVLAVSRSGIVLLLLV